MYQRSLPISLLALLLTPVPLLAQSITPATDGTGTQVLQDGNQYTITGGTRAQENLFHSFERLGLSTDEIATLLSQPGIENILGRVTGGDASFIDGLLQVQGSNANLYLMNPAGIVFGPNAQLDLSGSFLATTATGIGFGENWFNAVGDNTYADLVGNPDSFAFSLANSGSIANFGDLTVASGESITLLGGMVTNTGTLTAPNGTITLAAVPGENRVRLGQAGSLLSLELEAANGIWDTALNPVNLTPLSLPALLTGGNLANASQLTVNPDGTVRLNGANVPVQDGTTLVAGSLNAAGTDGEINVLGDRVALLNADLNVVGSNGGTVRIGGDYHGEGSVFNATHTYADANTQIHADALSQGDGGRVVLWADGNTQFAGNITARGGSQSGNGGFVEVSGAQNLLFNGLVDVSASAGQAGTLLLDPTNITISGGTDSAGVSAALPDIFAGDFGTSDITISSTTLSNQSGNIVLQATNNITVDTFLSFVPGGSITFEADFDSSGTGDFTMDFGGIQTNGRDISISGANISLSGPFETDGGAVALKARNNISATGFGGLDTSAVNDDGGAITFSAGGNITTTDLSTGSLGTRGNGGNISLTAVGSITTANLDTGPLTVGGNGGNIFLSASIGSIRTGNVSSSVSTGSTFLGTVDTTGNGGTISLDTSGGDITTGDLDSSSYSRNAGGIALRAGGNITTADLDAGSFEGSGAGITVTATGSIRTTDIFTSVFVGGDGGDIVLSASTGSITTGNLASAALFRQSGTSSSGNAGNGGNITLTAPGGNITTGSVDSSTYSGPYYDSISLSRSAWDRTGVSFNTNGTITSGDLVTGTYTGESFTSGTTGDAGTITFEAGGDITTGSLNSTAFSLTGTAGNAGTVTLTAGGNITVADFAAFSGSGNQPATTCEVNCGQNTVNNDIPQSINVTSVDQAARTLFRVQEQTGIAPALIYVGFVSTQISQPLDLQAREAIASQQITDYLNQPNPTEAPLFTVQPQDSDELELLLVLPNGDVVRHQVAGVTRAMVFQQRQQLITEITAPNRLRSHRYRVPAQRLYEWLIAPLEAELEAQNIGNLSFILDAGLRSLPISALYDGQQFLIERYNIGLLPSLSLTDTQYHDLRGVPILAMGASEFENLQPLAAVPIELQAVTAVVPDSVSYLNQEFTQENLLQSRYERPFGIVHLATHAEFLPGQLSNSFLQFGDRRLPLDAIRDLRLNDPPVELLVLSACKTAFGDEQAELGFGGLAVQAGVRSVLASLWYVSDTGTLAFMSEFYRQLQEAPTRSEALRQTQLALLQGKTELEGDQLITTRGTAVAIPAHIADTSTDLTHPYFWASFTMIGSPW